MRYGRGALWLGLLLSLVGCDDEPDGFWPSCDYSQNGSDADGFWRLKAAGQRYDCAERRLDGVLTLELSESIQVQSMAEAGSSRSAGVPGAEARSEADVFIERIERADYALSASALPAGARFEGQTVGSCVSFTLREELEGGDEQLYLFEGSFAGSSEIRGTFEGRGPAGCESSGAFSVRIE